MNKIVRERYPVANLPEDLRAEFEGLDTVTVSIQAEAITGRDFWPISLDQMSPRNPAEIPADIQRIRHSGLPGVTPEEAVKRIRELRDEWDDE
jgi:hypothetical protein